MFNLKQNFIGQNICDMCNANTDSIQSKFRESMFERKTKEMYSQKIREISKDPSKCITYGIHGPCALNELKFFHTSNNYSLDIMHDIYEGVVPYELCLILKIFIYEKKFFTLNFLNERILLFNYGKLEIKNRPGSIIMDSQKNGSL